MSDTATTKPIEVPVNPLPGLTSQGCSALVVALCAMAADHFVQHHELIPAVMAGAAALGTWVAGALAHIRTVGLFKAINELVPDSVVRAKQ